MTQMNCTTCVSSGEYEILVTLDGCIPVNDISFDEVTGLEKESL